MKKQRTWFAADKTGFHMLHTLFQTSLKYPSVTRYDEWFVTKLLVDDGRVQGVVALGFPVHFAALLGAWKVLGAIAILVPGLPLVKEWAYAGIVFDLTGAASASLATGSIASMTASATTTARTNPPRSTQFST